jgi:hypothetical protein
MTEMALVEATAVDAELYEVMKCIRQGWSAQDKVCQLNQSRIVLNMVNCLCSRVLLFATTRLTFLCV